MGPVSHVPAGTTTRPPPDWLHASFTSKNGNYEVLKVTAPFPMQPIKVFIYPDKDFIITDFGAIFRSKRSGQQKKQVQVIKLRKYLLIISLLYYPTYQDKTFLAISHSENREFVSH